MSRELVCVLAPVLGPVKSGPPFVVRETLTVHEAAMIYRDRHPACGFLRDLNIYDPKHIAILEGWIGRRDPPAAKLLGDLRMQPEESNEPRIFDEWLNMYFGGDEAQRSRDKRDHEPNWRISWEVAVELSAAIASGAIAPMHTERDPEGRPIPLACMIWLADLLEIACRRGDAGEIVSSLLTWYEPSESEPSADRDQQTSRDRPSTGSPVRFTAQYIAGARTAGRLATQAGLESAWKAAERKGHREPLRAAFKEAMGEDAPKRGRPKKSPN
jgi:hypothetical protein